MCVCGISRISPSWARAGCKKTLCLLHYPRKIKFIHSFIHSFSLSVSVSVSLSLSLSLSLSSLNLDFFLSAMKQVVEDPDDAI